MTPLIDVVMCLIVFYLMVGKMANDRVARVELPSSKQGVAEAEREGLVINVLPGEGGGAKMIVDGVEVGESALEAMLRALGGSGAVTIRADRALSYEPVGRIVALCRGAGLGSVRLAATRGGG